MDNSGISSDKLCNIDKITNKSSKQIMEELALNKLNKIYPTTSVN